ncbi:hypothetical protein [Ancylobacter rudongensis]|uniref:Uncharacterized protein n=1 Tax=Ancylobacter rudongensis TaxID=177413 RepID=A0A1G4UPZ8_9HYPH|nr:hypothetical protein [Ancylobacter rudongensis]SCW95710.1 hypothetical protein SAMN05660859_0098 [Ancylobacter rudongensis]
MIDHLLRYPDEATAMAALPAYASEGIEPGVRIWDMTCVIPNVAAYRIMGSEAVDDGEGGTYEHEIREYLPGWYLIIARPERDPALEGEACVLIGDRETGAVLHAITTPEDLATLYLEPTFAGSDYPFGAPIIATVE